MSVRTAKRTAEILAEIFDACAYRRYSDARAIARRLYSRLVRCEREREFPGILADFVGSDKYRAGRAARELRKLAFRVGELYPIGKRGDLFLVFSIGHCDGGGEHGVIFDSMHELFHQLEHAEPCSCEYCEYPADNDYCEIVLPAETYL